MINSVDLMVQKALVKKANEQFNKFIEADFGKDWIKHFESIKDIFDQLCFNYDPNLSLHDIMKLFNEKYSHAQNNP